MVLESRIRSHFDLLHRATMDEVVFYDLWDERTQLLEACKHVAEWMDDQSERSIAEQAAEDAFCVEVLRRAIARAEERQ